MPGDVVVLKSDFENKLKMTVKEVNVDKAICYSIDVEKGDIKELNLKNGIPLIVLQKIK